MDRLDRIFTMHRILQTARYPVPRQRLAERLECSESTVYRVRDALITHFGAPIEGEPETGNLYYDLAEEENFELPGLWFNASELHALLTAQKLLTDVQPGVIDEELAPLRDRIDRILSHRHLGGGELAHRIRILSIADRSVEPGVFRILAAALLERRRLTLYYRPRSSGRSGERDVSPQRLTRYRDNWYLDAWCHRRRDLRSFAVDRIDNPKTLAEAAKDIEESELDRRLATAYGIFSGEPTDIAVLRFQPERAEWIADETWHPQQEGCWLRDGRYELRIPYGDPTELILDILRYGDDVEVIEPETLRRQVAQKLEKAAMRYRVSESNR